MYVLTGDCDGPEVPTHAHASEIPGFGYAVEGESLRELSYFVFNRGSPVRVDHISQPSGAVRHYVGARLNADAVNFSPGGEHRAEAVIEGLLTCFSDSPPARKLYRCFQRALRDLFEKHGDSFVGPGALAAHKRGIRLAQSVKSPPDWDLKVRET